MLLLDVVAASPYNLLYTLAVAAAGWAMFDAGRRRGWPAQTWAFAVGGWIAGGVLGAMLPRLIFGDAIAARTSVGAILVASLVLAGAAKALRRSTAEALDTTAIAIPLGASIVRIGCFLGECCQGIVTSLPIGVSLHADDLPRHPTQLYEASLEIALVAWLNRRHGPVRRGRQFAASLAGMCAIRFATEFLRDNDKLAGLSLAQWVVLPVGILCLIVLLSRSRETRSGRVLTSGARAATVWTIGGLSIIALAIELPALETTVLLLTIGILLAAWFRRLGRASPAGLAAIMLQMPTAPADSTYPQVLKFFGGGMSFGAWNAIHQLKNCEGTVDEEWSRRHRSAGGMIEFGARRIESATRAQTIRVKGYYDTDVVDRAIVVRGTAPNPQGYTQHSAGVNVVADRDWRYVGLSLGFSAGSFYPALEQTEYANDGRARPFHIFPAFGVRVGALRGPSVEMRLGDESPMWMPGSAATFAAGIADSSGNRLRLGVSEAGLFIAARTHNKSGLEFAPMLVVGGGGGGGDSGAKELIAGGIAFRKWFTAAPRSPSGK